MNLVEVANTLRADKGSIDAVLLTSSQGNPESFKDIHTFIKNLCPSMLPVIIDTTGADPDGLDDLIGAGYVNGVTFHLMDRPTPDQKRSMSIAESNGVEFAVCPFLDSTRMTADDVMFIADSIKGYSQFILLMPADPAKSYKKKDLNTLAKALKGHARNVRVLDDFRSARGPGPRSG